MDYGNAFGIEFRETKEMTHDGRPARSVSGARSYDTDIEDLWDAVTNPDRIRRWFLPVSGDLKLGGRYQLEGHAGGKILDCDPPALLRATWEYGDDVSWITVTLKDDPKGARLTLEHVMLQGDKADEHWKQYGPGATGVGWELAFLALDYSLSNGNAAIDPAENTVWLSSAEGKAFIRASAAKWGEAHIAAGEQSDVANAMADRTARFYTAE